MAKQRIAQATGVVPQFVRPPEGEMNQAVFAAYASQDLQCIFWDMATGDDVRTADFGSVMATLVANLKARLLAQDTDITILFHDVHGHTADNMLAYLEAIEETVQLAGGTVQFALVEDGPDC